MKRVSSYIAAFRLRTLLLSMTGVLLGMLLAVGDGAFRILPFILALTTTLCLQILSNISNELGDTLHGTDTEERQGAIYPLQNGELTIGDYRRMIVWFVILSIVSGTALVATSFDILFSREGIFMLVLGGCAILAAMGYTLGRRPYGYRGWGDLFVFIFFGLVSTSGSNFLMTGQMDWNVLLPASACGFLTVGVLNVNNIRDMETDRINRVTIPIIIGERRAKIYQIFCETLPFVLLTVYCVLEDSAWPAYLFWLLLPVVVLHLRAVWRESGRALDARLPQLVLLTAVICLSFAGLQLL